MIWLSRMAFCSLSILILTGILAGMQPTHTVPGPETDRLLSTTQGHLIFSSTQGITSAKLPTLTPSHIWQHEFATIHAISGPDAEGRIALIEDHFFAPDAKDKRHFLKFIHIDGSNETELFSRSGSAMWATSPAGKGEISRQIALAPTGGNVAFLSTLKSVQMPKAYLNLGQLEIWNLQTQTGKQLELELLDQGMSWFPDGKRLAIVKLINPDLLPKSSSSELPAAFQDWPEIPAVFIFDLQTNSESFVQIGWQPVVARDGKSMLVSNDLGNWSLVDLATGGFTAVEWPGQTHTQVIALLDDRKILAWCLPTQGNNVGLTENNSPLSGPKQLLSLKLVDLTSKEYQTVIPQLDPRNKVSFGQ